MTRHSFIFSWQEKEKDKEKTKEKDKDSKEKEKDKKLLNGHLFTATSVVAQATCYHCMKPFNKDSYYCASKSCLLSSPSPFCFSLNLMWEMWPRCHIVLTLLNTGDVGQEGGFGAGDSCHDGVPCGAELKWVMGAWSWPAASCLARAWTARHPAGVSAPACRDGSVRWRTWVISAAWYGLRLRWFVKIHMGQRKPPWIMAFIASGCPTHLWYIALYTLVIWNMTSVSLQQKRNMKRKR